MFDTCRPFSCPRRFRPACLMRTPAMRSPLLPRRAPAFLLTSTLLLAMLLAPGPAVAQTPLHDRIDQLVAASTPDFSDPKKRAPARFYLDRNGDPNEATRDISRVFLGMNLQCAQCHDHPLVADYKQEFYYGLIAFLNRSYVAPDPKLRMIVFAEKAEGEVSFQSVFDPAKVTKTTGPRVPGRPAVKEPKFAKGDEYVVKPAGRQRGVPRFSRRALLGAELARADNVEIGRASC